jgi:hypothetical protein
MTACRRKGELGAISGLSSQTRTILSFGYQRTLIQLISALFPWITGNCAAAIALLPPH